MFTYVHLFMCRAQYIYLSNKSRRRVGMDTWGNTVNNDPDVFIIFRS
jgi:hypothetical protein